MSAYTCIIPEEVRHPCALCHYFYISRPRSHIKLYIEYDFNYMKGARRRTDVVPPLVLYLITDIQIFFLYVAHFARPIMYCIVLYCIVLYCTGSLLKTYRDSLLV